MGIYAGTIPKEQILTERVNREKARRHLIDFSEYIAAWYRAAEHHKIVGAYLEEVERYVASGGEEGIGRLMLFEPPRHGKSEQVSRMFPAWILGRNPDWNVILTSYGSSLATGHSRAVRARIQDPKFMNLFGERSTKDVENPVQLSSDSRSVEAWDLAAPHRGGLIAAGVGGAITGKGAHVLIIDDPFKNRSEAESNPHRENVMDWYRSSAYTRLEDSGAIVVMHTRWHSQDMAGQLITNMAKSPGADQWVIVLLPAIWEGIGEIPEGKMIEGYKREMMLRGVWVADGDPLEREIGEALWPGKFSAGDLEHIKQNVGSYEWEALYQQAPYSRAGNMFKRACFTIVDNPPTENIIMRIRYWDKAATAGGGAYTSGVCMSRTSDGMIYVEHVRRGQWSTYEREENMIRTAKLDAEHRPGTTVHWHEQEPAGSGKDSAKVTNANLAAAGIEAHFEPASGSKEVRAGPWSSALEAGIVRLVRGAWNEEYIERHVAFPKGKFKDDVDGSSAAFLKIQDTTLTGDLFF